MNATNVRCFGNDWTDIGPNTSTKTKPVETGELDSQTNGVKHFGRSLNTNRCYFPATRLFGCSGVNANGSSVSWYLLEENSTVKFGEDTSRRALPMRSQAVRSTNMFEMQNTLMKSCGGGRFGLGSALSMNLEIICMFR